MTFKMLQEEIAKEQQIFLTFGNEHLSSVFLEIAENPFYYENEYLLLKALELIWLSSHCIKKDRKKQAQRNTFTNRYRLFEKAVRYMEFHISDNFTMEEMSKEMGINLKQRLEADFIFCFWSLFFISISIWLQVMYLIAVLMYPILVDDDFFT